MHKLIASGPIAGALLMLLMSQSVLAAVPPSPPRSETAQQPPWFQHFHFRREIVVSNPTNAYLIGYPVLLLMGFPQTHLLSGAIELRLVSEKGAEVPSFVIDEEKLGDFVTSILVLFFTNLKPSSNESLWLYYGDISAGLPQYRQEDRVASVSLKELSVGFGSLQDPSSIDIGFGKTFSQALESSISFSSPLQSFGSDQLADQPLTKVKDWHSDGNASAFGATIDSSTFQAGTLRYSRVVVLSNSTLTFFDAILNSGNSTIDNVSLSVLTNNTSLAKLGPLTTTFDSNESLLTASVGGALVGFAAVPAPNAFDVGKPAQVSSEVKANSLRGRFSASGASAAALHWSIGRLSAADSAVIREGWAIAGSNLSLRVGLLGESFVQKFKLGNEQISGVYTPSATGLWQTTIPLANQTILSPGLSLPLSLVGGVLLPDSIGLNGTVSYIEPSANFSLPSNRLWHASSFSTPNATAYSSPSFYSVGERATIARLDVFDSQSDATGRASLTSVVTPLPGGSNVQLVIRYRATLSLTEGNSSRQRFYAALDIDNSFRGSFDQTLLFPVTGSLTTVNDTSCGQPERISREPSTIPPRKTTMGGYLVGDGTWRTLDLNLRNWISSRGAQFVLRFCVASDGAFSGHMDLQIESGGVRVDAPAQDLITARISHLRPAIDLSIRGGPSQSPRKLETNLKMSFLVASKVEMAEGQGASFDSPLPEPSRFVINASSPLKNSSAFSHDLRGLVVYTPFYPLVSKLVVNGSSIDHLLNVNGSIFAAAGPLNGASEDPMLSPRVSLSLRGNSLSLQVVDANMNLLSGASLQLRGEGSPSTLNSTSDSSGRAVFEVPPWNYTLTITFQGSVVATSSVNLDANQSLRIGTAVFPVFFRVVDALGHTLSGASVLLSRENFTEGGVSDVQGALGFQVVANNAYAVSVDVGGENYYRGNLTASINSATITLGTTYSQPTLRAGVAALVVISVVGVGGMLYLQKRLYGIIRRKK